MPTATKATKPPVKKVKKPSETTSATSPIPKPSLWTRLNVRLSHKDKLFFAKYLSILLNAGLPLDNALGILDEQSKGALKTIVNTVTQDVRNGRTLADGLARFPHVFSNIFVNLIRAGETSGILEKNLNYLANQLQKQYDLTRSVRGAMIYPVIVLAGGAGVSVLVIMFVLPNIVSLFQTLDVELPFTTKVLIWVANVAQNYPLHIGIGFFGSLIGFYFFSKLRFGKAVIDLAALYFPIIKTLVRSSTLARAFRLIGTLLQSGMPIEPALNITISTIRHTQYNKLFRDAQLQIKQGGELNVILKQSPQLVPPIAQHLIHVGSETGTLVDSLLYLAEFYEKEVEETSKRISTLMEPILIITMGIAVTFLAFSIISPIYQVVGNIQ